MATLNAHIIECHQRDKYNIEPRSLLDFKVDLAERHADGRSFRKKMMSSHIDNENTKMKLDNSECQPVLGDEIMHNYKICNKKVAAETQGKVRWKNGQQSPYFHQKHRTHTMYQKCGVGLCMARERNCLKLFHYILNF